MTSNQIAFARVAEDKRHNIQTEMLGRDTYSEGARHNLVTERQNWYTAEQNASIGWANVKINQTNAITQSRNADANWFNAQTNAINAQTNIVNSKTMEENMRINKQQADTAQRRMENDFELGRLNVQNTWKDLDISYQNMLTQRTNVSNNYLLGLGNLAVNRQRVNNDYIVGMANVAVNRQRVNNDYIVGMANVTIGQRANEIRSIQVGQEGNRIANEDIRGRMSITEQTRHNQATESIQRGNLWSTEGVNASITTKNYASIITDAAKAAGAFVPLIIR